MPWIKQVSIALLFLVIVLTSSCIGLRSNPPPTFHDSDLVGTWKADYSKYRDGSYRWDEVKSVEVLVFRSDGTYQQIYDDGEGARYTSTWNKWWVERFPEGAIRVHLEGGVFYPAQIEYGFGLSYITYRDDGSGHPLILDDRGTLLIVKVPFPGSSEAYLQYPPVGDPDSPIVVEFFRDGVNDTLRP